MDKSVSNHFIKSVKFQTYSAEEIRKLSVLEITNPELLDCLGNACPGGLYDLRLGPNDRDDVCLTCGLSFITCAGHVGHISLPVTVYNPVFLTHLYQLLRGTCFHCHRLLAAPIALQLTIYQLKALDHGLVSTVQRLAEVVSDDSLDKVPDSDIPFALQNKLEQTFQEALKEHKTETHSFLVKSVVEARRNILKQFVKNQMMNVGGKCPYCRTVKKKLVRYGMKIVYRNSNTGAPVNNEPEDDKDAVFSSAISTKELMPEEARQNLIKLWENDSDSLKHLYKTLYKQDLDASNPIDMFFMNVVIVPPSRFRRMNFMHGKKYADQQTMTLCEVLKDCINMRSLMRKFAEIEISDADKIEISKLVGKTDTEKYSNLYQQLQRHVTEIFDSDVNKERNKISKGIKQTLEKKEGIFRMNMMGKRVNFAARSVISPDPYIMVNEIGVPMVFAKMLTFPEPVTYQNCEILRNAVKNGPNVHPGASFVTMEDGRKVKLPPDDPGKRRAIANTLLTPQSSAVKTIGGVKIVHRHLKNGDMLLLNRQPTLHKPSIMAHKARVLPGEKTLRLHYSNCKSYNADFDGDEMNCHFPQSYLGQAESRYIVSVNHQYLVPKDGTPLGGLLQDHIIAAVLLTVRGRFFTLEAYQQLVYSAISFKKSEVKFLPPTLLKPEVLWAGKQIVSTLIINLVPEGKIPPSMDGKTKVSAKNWKSAAPRNWEAGGTPLKGDSMSECEVIIRNGELLCGVIDKAQIGSTPYSLIHLCYELYGGEMSSVLLTALARLFTHCLQYFFGFTLGVEDIVVLKKANKKRRNILKTSDEKGLAATAKALDVPDLQNPDRDSLLFKYKNMHFNRDDFGLKTLDMEMKTVTHSLNNDINEVCIPSGLKKKFPSNNLQLMVESGAKGSSVNAMQISCLLGQIELEGRRMPLQLNGATLPSFEAYTTSPLAGGFVGGRFLSGIIPPEYFFHCMAGREGLIDTAVKTSRSGYLQRCLIKHLEGITVHYDQTVRDSDGTVIQYLYGEDGMDPLKMQLLKKNRLNLLDTNSKAVKCEDEIKFLKARLENDERNETLPSLALHKEKIEKWKKKQINEVDSKRLSSIPGVDYQPHLKVKERVKQLLSSVEELYGDEKREKKRCPDPVNSLFQPDLNIGSISENMDALIEDYLSKNPRRSHGKQNASRDSKSSKSCKKSKKSKHRNSDPENDYGHEKQIDSARDLFHYWSLKSLVEPGESVGLLAAQSVGEPSTQMTLNTFHFAGKGEMNVTLGIPRIREILMTASPNIATPTMDLPLLNVPDIERKAEKLKLKFSPVALKDVLDNIKIREYLKVTRDNAILNSRNYEVKMKFLKFEEYRGHLNTSPSRILAFIESSFVKIVIQALRRKLKLSASSRTIEIKKEANPTFVKSESNGADDVDNPAPAARKDDGGESSAESEGEGDSTSTKAKARRNQEQEYQDPEDEEIMPDSSEENEDDPVSAKQDASEDDDQEEKTNISDKTKEVQRRRGAIITDEEKAIRINAIKCTHSWVDHYDFDSTNERWCTITFQLPLSSSKIDMQSVLDEEISKTNIYSVPHIKEALLINNPNAQDGSKMLKTNGVNFLEVFNHVDVLDVNKIYSNNIHEIAKIFGIEAAARAIRKEIVSVFAAYGIQVDPRHLSLIADYMTCSGEYRPCNRLGMGGNASPLQQITFETSTNFLVESMLNGVEDKLESPSSNITVGQLSKAGTGLFSVRSRRSVLPKTVTL